MDLNNKIEFNQFQLLCFYISIGYIVCIMVLFYIIGKTVTTKIKNLIVLSAGSIVVMPYLLKADLSWQYKIIITSIGMASGFIYLTGINVIGNILKKIANFVFRKYKKWTGNEDQC